VALAKTPTQLPTVKVAEAHPYLRALFFGVTGVGKTWLAATAAKVEGMYPVLFLDFDKGLRTLSEWDPEILERIDVLPMNDINDINIVKRVLHSEDNSYRTVVLDSLTALQAQLIRARLQDPERSQKEDPFIPGLRDYQHAVWRIRTVVNILKGVPAHFIALALAALKEDETERIERVMPALSSTLSNEIGAEFDLVGYLYLRARGEDIKRYMQLAPVRGRLGKVRGTLPTTIESPTLDVLYSTLCGERALEKGESKND